MESGFAQDDAYNLYDGALFSGTSANMIYKPNIAHQQKVDEKFETMVSKQASGKRGEVERDGPVQFEKEVEDSDLFGMDAFMNAAKRGDHSHDNKRQKK